MDNTTIKWTSRNDLVEKGFLNDKHYTRRKDKPEIIHSSSDPTKENYKCEKCGTQTSGVRIISKPCYKDSHGYAGFYISTPYCKVCEPNFIADLSKEYDFEDATWIKK